MMIENAERFGLAQLHQLRGRVGRGDAQSYCIMVNASDSKNSMKRLDILNKSNDGFKIASEDLKLRGPGDFLASASPERCSFAGRYLSGCSRVTTGIRGSAGSACRRPGTLWRRKCQSAALSGDFLRGSKEQIKFMTEICL